MEKDIKAIAQDNTIAIHMTNNMEIHQGNGYQTISVNGVDLSKIIADMALANVQKDEGRWKELNFWGTIDIIITQNVAEEQCLGSLQP